MKCSKCGTKISVFNQSGNLCKTCIENTPGWREATAALEAKRLEDEARERLAKQEAERERRKRATRLILTTETAHNLPVTDRLGIVTAEVVFGVNVFKDLFADARGIVGGRSQTIQKVLRDAREECLKELKAEALDLDADAVVGIDLDYADIGGNGKMVMLVASGTAVKLEDEQ